MAVERLRVGAVHFLKDMGRAGKRQLLLLQHPVLAVRQLWDGPERARLAVGRSPVRAPRCVWLPREDAALCRGSLLLRGSLRVGAAEAAALQLRDSGRHPARGLDGRRSLRARCQG